MAEQIGSGLIYSPLEEGQARLARMNHSGSTFIECELHTFSIQEMPVYKALSYCWTKEEAIFEIRMNEHAFWVRPNLHAYLKIMSEERHTCWIFIDALCINQEDIAERGRQVNLMCPIYGGAEEVIAWLNTPLDQWITEEDPNNIEDLYDVLQALCNSDKALSAAFGTEKRVTSTDSDTLLSTMSVAFLQTEYWSRVWIVQEVLLASALTFRAGRLKIRSIEFKALIVYIKDSYNVHGRFKDLTDPVGSLARSDAFGGRARGDRDSIKTSHIDFWGENAMVAAHLMDLWHQLVAESRSTTLTDVVLSYSRQSCSELFDIVFGVLGLTNSVLQPSYEMSRLEFFLRVLIESVVDGLRFSKMKEMKEPGSDQALIRV